VSHAAETTEAEFRALFDEVCTWGRWPDRPELGCLNYLTPDRIVAASALVSEGRTVSLGRSLDTRAGPDNPQPAEHHMTLMPDTDIGAGAVRFAKDYIGADFHNDGYSHLDAFGHVIYHGRLYGGLSDDVITADGAQAASIALLRDGLVSRGVLLDIPGLHGVERLEPGAQVHAGELEAAETRVGLRIGPGDVLLVRTAGRKAGLHPSAVRFLADRQVAAMGSDGNNDASPSATKGVGFPIHVLAVNAMGLHLMDYLQFERLTEVCATLGRWEFLIVVAPLRIAGGTGSPVNPIAIF
jgi:hypothetical protein